MAENFEMKTPVKGLEAERRLRQRASLSYIRQKIAWNEGLLRDLNRETPLARGRSFGVILGELSTLRHQERTLREALAEQVDEASAPRGREEAEELVRIIQTKKAAAKHEYDEEIARLRAAEDELREWLRRSSFREVTR